MDHNRSGQAGLNRDYTDPEDRNRDCPDPEDRNRDCPDPEDRNREKTGPEVPEANETETGSGKSTDEGFVQGSLDPQDPSAERPYQGSLDPQEPSTEKAYQGSLNPQGPSAGTRKQGSLNPQYTEQQKAVQGSLDPRACSGLKDVQGRLASESGKADSPSPRQTAVSGSTGADTAGKGHSAGQAALSGPLSGEAVSSAAASGEAVSSAAASGETASSGAGVPAGSEASVPVSSGTAGSGNKAAEQAESPAGTVGGSSKDTVSGASGTVGGSSKDAVSGASGTVGGSSEDAVGGSSEAAAAGALAAAAAGAARTTATAGTSAAEVSPAEAGAKGSSAAPGTAVMNIPAAGQADAEEQKKEKRKKKSRRKALAFWISFLLILLMLGGVYYGGYKYCETHFMPGSTINGFDCSGLTEEEAEKRFADAADKYTLNIRFRGGSTEVLTAQDIGFAYKPDGSIGAMIYGQDRTLWPRYFFEDYSYSLELGGSYDPDLLTSALSALPELQDENMQKPEDAYIQFMDGNETEDGSFQIVPDDPGNTVDLVQLAAGAGDAAARYEQDIDAEQIAGAYKEAALKADDADLVARCKDLNDLVGASITYTLPDHTELKLNSDVMKDWLVRDEKGRLVKDDEVWDEKIWEFMELLAYNSNTIGIDREFNSTARGTITVTGGDYGYMVNQIVEHDLLVKDLAEGKVETRKPSYYISAYNDETENDGIGRTYMEVDLTAQHMWCYIDGKMVLETDCVTGDPTTKHETPTGVFGIMFMKKDATLRGIQQKNGKYEYETKVKYWMPFYNDCGFHDAWWRTAFGGDIYKGDGSHGCVNLPSEAAEELFSYCEDKMPVVVYK